MKFSEHQTSAMKLFGSVRRHTRTSFRNLGQSTIAFFSIQLLMSPNGISSTPRTLKTTLIPFSTKWTRKDGATFGETLPRQWLMHLAASCMNGMAFGHHQRVAGP